MWLVSVYTEIVQCCLTEEDTSERGKGAEEVGLPCNRTLSHVDIGSSLDALGVGGLVGHLVRIVHVGDRAEGVGRIS